MVKLSFGESNLRIIVAAIRSPSWQNTYKKLPPLFTQ